MAPSQGMRRTLALPDGSLLSRPDEGCCLSSLAQGLLAPTRPKAECLQAVLACVDTPAVARDVRCANPHPFITRTVRVAPSGHTPSCAKRSSGVTPCATASTTTASGCYPVAAALSRSQQTGVPFRQPRSRHNRGENSASVRPLPRVNRTLVVFTQHSPALRTQVAPGAGIPRPGPNWSPSFPRGST